MASYFWTLGYNLKDTNRYHL